MNKVLKNIERNNLYIFLLVVISTLFLFPIFHPGLYISHDGEAHVARFASYFLAFIDGQIPPRWAGNLNSGYGTAIFIFFYPLPGYIASLLHLLKIDFETCFKLIMFLSNTLSPICLYLWLKEHAKQEVAFLTAVAYLALPYRFLDVLVRGDVAETLSFVFVPLVFLYIDRIFKNENIISIILGGLFYALLILSHNAIAIIFTPVIIFYIIFFTKNIINFIKAFGVIIIGLILSSYFWLPALIEKKYVYSNLLVEQIFKDNFVSLIKLFYSNWGFGSEVNLTGGLSPQIGILYFSIVVIALIVCFKLKKKKEIVFWLSIFFFSAFMTTKFSSIFWEHLPVIKLMGYPWRFTALSGFASCMIFFHLVKLVNKKYYIFIFLVLIFSAMPFIKVKGYTEKKIDNFYLLYKGTTDYHMRTMTKWVAGDFGQISKRQFEIISGQGLLKNENKKTNLHEFDVIARTDLRILDNAVYYPGWRVEVDGKKMPIEFQDNNHRGLITFGIPAGNHRVKVEFRETFDRLITDLISMIGLFICVIYLVIYKFKNKY